MTNTDGVAVSSKDENQDRGNWDKKADYLLSCIGYAVGLGNVWRFPYLAFDNGGGAFLVPYFIMLILAGLPVFFLECSLGQFTSMGPISAFKFSPILRGIGACMVILNIFVSIYYNVIIAYTVFYFFASLTPKLPWTECGMFWNTQNCSEVERCDLNLTSYLNNSIANDFIRKNNFSATGIIERVEVSRLENLTEGLNVSKDLLGCDTSISVSPSEEFWEHYVLTRSSDINETGEVNIGLLLSLLVSWFVIYFSMIRGVKSSGKVVYFTAIFPYVVLAIFLVRGATLEGASQGVQFYIGNQTNWTKIGEAEVWQKAATQIFFSLSAAWGGLIALSSYNKFNNDCYTDSLIVVFVNSFTSIFAGFAIFTVVGHMAFKLGKPVKNVVQDGFSLAFVAYPTAIQELPISPLWAILFFLMLFTLGLDSQFTTIEAIMTSLIDLFPRQLRAKRAPITLASVVILFLLGIPCVTESGIYWLNLLDTYAASWGLLIMAILEVIGVAWIYGGNNFIKDIEMMIGKKSWWFWLYWRVCWFFVTPVLLILVLVWSFVTLEEIDYAGVKYPGWAVAIGWLTIGFSLLFIPGLGIYAIINKKGFLAAVKPADDWGPYLKQFRGERYATMAEPREALALHEALAYENKKSAENGAENAAYDAESDLANTAL